MNSEQEVEAEDQKKGHQTSIVINGRKKTVTGTEVTFKEIVHLAFEELPQGENVVFTVTYRRGPKENPEGTLIPGGKVEIKEGMIFNVTATDKS